MLKARMDYGAISAKVLALYGKLLKEDEWRRLCECAAPADVLTALKSHPGWSAYVSELPAGADTERLKEAVKAKRRRDWEKLLHFCGREDREMLSLLESNTRRGSLDVFADIKKNYSGTGRAELIRLLGAQADLLNLVSILRLHRYFPDSLGRAEELLVPVFGKLKPQLTQELIAARSESEALALLKQSPFAPYFEDYKPRQLDRLYEQAMISFCRKVVKMPEPNVCVPVAYLTLSELECGRLIRIIEALGYGMKPEEL